MSANHVSPAVRGRRHRRQLARLPPSGNEVPPFAQEKSPLSIVPRSPGLLDLGNGEDGTNFLDIPGLGGVGGGGPGLTQSATTIVNTVALPFTTILQTQVATVLVPIQSSSQPAASTPTPTSPTQQSNTQSQSSSSQASSSSQTSSSTTSSSTSSSATSSSLSDTSSATSATSANASVTPPPSPGTPAADNGSTINSTRTISSTISSSATPANGASQVAAANKGLSGGAIGGIVAVSVIAGIVMLIWVVRMIFLRRRSKRRETFIWPKPDFSTEQDRGNDISEKMFLRTGGQNPPPVPEKAPISLAVPALTPPPMSYNNPAPSPATARVQSPTLMAGAAAVSLSPASAGDGYAHVRCTYIPNLPDELSVTVGEMVRVLNEYDDGWALCINARNEQGVVPSECLDRNNAPLMKNPGQYLGQGTGDWRMSRRASSLNGAQNAAALRY